MTTRIGIYAGSFDPITYGHLSVISKAARVVDKLVIVIASNPTKKGMFAPDERLHLIRETMQSWGDIDCELSAVVLTNRFVIDYALEIDARYIFRGIRSVSDFETEYAMALTNMEICEQLRGIAQHAVDTVFLPADPMRSHVSSSGVKAMMGPVGWETIAEKYVPPVVLNALKGKLNVE